MGAVENIITDNLPIWSSAIQSKSSAGRGTNTKRNLYGVKKLRELILDLAVRGLLVPQDPNDEPASVLLEKIAAEKKRLVNEGAIRKGKKSSSNYEDIEPYCLIPSAWRWVELSEIGHDWGQKKPDREFSYIDVGSINKDQGKIQTLNSLLPQNAPSRARKIVRENTVIYSTVRPYLLNIAVIKENIHPEPIASTAFAIIHPFCKISSDYVYYYLRSKIFTKYVESYQTGTSYPAINDKNFFAGLIPLPPLAEQHRIVAKVDELMALCDTLEQQQEDSIQAHETLVEVLLEALSNAVDADAFQAAWGSISEHFDSLFTTEHSINKLKETILRLAVMGKLVSQDPSDEPASVLLEKIAAEKERLVKEGEIKKHKVTPIHESEHPFILPPGWKWQRLISLTKLITKGSSPKWQGVSYSENTDDVLFVTSENVDSFKLKFIKKKYVEIKFNEIEPRSVLKRNDILMNIVGASIGRTAVFDIDTLANINQAVCLIRTLGNFLSGNFLLIFFNSEVCKNYMFDKQVDNARANLSMGNISNFVLPIPPLAEQHRIVAKVDELMALCDQLRSSLQQAQETQIQLTDAVVENAL